MNGMNLMNSSLINENIDATSVITVTELESTVPLLTIPKSSNMLPIANAYIIYPAKRATARRISLRDGILNIAL